MKTWKITFNFFFKFFLHLKTKHTTATKKQKKEFIKEKKIILKKITKNINNDYLHCEACVKSKREASNFKESN